MFAAYDSKQEGALGFQASQVMMGWALARWVLLACAGGLLAMGLLSAARSLPATADAIMLAWIGVSAWLFVGLAFQGLAAGQAALNLFFAVGTMGFAVYNIGIVAPNVLAGTILHGAWATAQLGHPAYREHQGFLLVWAALNLTLSLCLLVG